ncbi:MAG TPA: Fis family transcriptional regulator, partial [Desulfovibrio sp.]|nr:Fis family transcriptional regulator [Desulfovibrio sp.]
PEEGEAASARAGEGPLPSLKIFKEAREREYIERLLRECGQDVGRMIEISGLSRSHLYALLKKYAPGA